MKKSLLIFAIAILILPIWAMKIFQGNTKAPETTLPNTIRQTSFPSSSLKAIIIFKVEADANKS